LLLQPRGLLRLFRPEMDVPGNENDEHHEREAASNDRERARPERKKRDKVVKKCYRPATRARAHCLNFAFYGICEPVPICRRSTLARCGYPGACEVHNLPDPGYLAGTLFAHGKMRRDLRHFILREF